MATIGIDASRAVTAQRTGTENYSYQLIRHLLPLADAHAIRLYYNAAPRSDLFAARGNVQERLMPFPRLWTHLRLSWEMLRQPPDLLFVPSHVLPVIHPRRSVVTVHDLGYLYYPQAHPILSRWYLDLSTRYNARVATRVIADSVATQRDLVAHYGVPAAKITVVYPGRDPAIAPVRDSARLTATLARYGLMPGYILYVGTLHPRKNLTRLVEAYALLRQQPPPHGEWPLLVLAGKRGWMYGRLAGHVRELGLEREVIFPGYVAQADLAALYTGAACFVMPSLYEGFGLPLLEAMACGVPVVAADASSLPEVAGDAALLVAPTDVAAWAAALARVLVDAPLQRELVARGLERAARFSWQRCACETLAVLEEALADSNS